MLASNEVCPLKGVRRRGLWMPARAEERGKMLKRGGPKCEYWWWELHPPSLGGSLVTSRYALTCWTEHWKHFLWGIRLLQGKYLEAMKLEIQLHHPTVMFTDEKIRSCLRASNQRFCLLDLPDYLRKAWNLKGRKNRKSNLGETDYVKGRELWKHMYY